MADWVSCEVYVEADDVDVGQLQRFVYERDARADSDASEADVTHLLWFERQPPSFDLIENFAKSHSQCRVTVRWWIKTTLEGGVLQWCNGKRWYNATVDTIENTEGAWPDGTAARF